MLDIRVATFISVAETKNYTRTAELLNLTQPAVTQHIKYLESFYGVKLIKKLGRKIELTEAGIIMYKFAKEMKLLHTTMQMDINKIKNEHSIYNLGTTMTIGGYVIPEILGEFKNNFMHIDIRLHVYNTEDILEKLINREVSLALVEGPFDKKKFNYEKFKADELVLAVSPLNSFSEKESVDIEEVLQGPIILREKGSGTRSIFENALLKLGYDLSNFEPYMEIGSIAAIKSMVTLNLGYTIISRATIRNEVKQGSIKIIPIKDLNIFREFNFLYLGEIQDRNLRVFIDFCKNLK